MLTYSIDKPGEELDKTHDRFNEKFMRVEDELSYVRCDMERMKLRDRSNSCGHSRYRSQSCDRSRSRGRNRSHDRSPGGSDSKLHDEVFQMISMGKRDQSQSYQDRDRQRDRRRERNRYDNRGRKYDHNNSRDRFNHSNSRENRNRFDQSNSKDSFTLGTMIIGTISRTIIVEVPVKIDTTDPMIEKLANIVREPTTLQLIAISSNKEFNEPNPDQTETAQMSQVYYPIHYYDHSTN